MLTDCVAHVERHVKWRQFVAWVLDGIAHGNPLLRFDTPPPTRHGMHSISHAVLPVCPVGTSCGLSRGRNRRPTRSSSCGSTERRTPRYVPPPYLTSTPPFTSLLASSWCLVGAVVPRGGGAVGGRGGGRGRGATKRFRRGREGAVAVCRGWRLLFVCVNCVCFYVETNIIMLLWKPGRGWNRALLGRERRSQARRTHALPRLPRSFFSRLHPSFPLRTPSDT